MRIQIKQGGSDSGHWLWFLQRISGIGLVLIIGIHWYLQHITQTPAEWNYATVIVRLSDPIFRTLYVLFLTFALFHGFHGLWMVGRDYLHAKWSRTSMAAVLVTAGISFFVWGVTIIIANYEVTQTGMLGP